MNQDIQVVNLILNPDEKFQVSARGLWGFLHKDTNYSFRDWWSNQVIAAKLVEGMDYIISRSNTAKLPGQDPRGRKGKDYLLTRHAVYELGMLNHGDKGKEIRQEFIDAKEQRDLLRIGEPKERITALKLGKECIVDILEVLNAFEIPKHIAQQEAIKHTIKITGVDFSEVLQIAPAQDNIQPEQRMLQPTDLGEKLGISGTKMNLVLAAAGLQERINGEWRPTKKAEGLYSEHAWQKKTREGYNYKWKELETLEIVRNGGYV